MFLRRAIQQLPLQYLLVFLAGLLALLRLFVFADEGPSASGAFPEAYSRYSALLSCLSFLLVASSTVFLQVFMRQTRLVESRKYYPLMLLPLLLMLFLRASDWFTVCFLFLLCAFCLPMLFSVYAKETYRQNTGLLFGMLCGLFSLMYAPLAVLLAVYYVLLGKHRLFNLRALLLPVAGLGLWVFYEWFFCFLCQMSFGGLMQYRLDQFAALGFRVPHLSWQVFLSWAVLLLLYVVVTYRMLRTLYTKNILIREKSILLFFLSLLFLLLFLLTPYENPVPLCGFSVVLVMILCEEENFMKSRFFCNLLFAVCWFLNILFFIV